VGSVLRGLLQILCFSTPTQGERVVFQRVPSTKSQAMAREQLPIPVTRSQCADLVALYGRRWKLPNHTDHKITLNPREAAISQLMNSRAAACRKASALSCLSLSAPIVRRHELVPLAVIAQHAGFQHPVIVAL
jgi:hypothetical protein